MSENSPNHIKGEAAIEILRTFTQQTEFCTMVTGVFQMLFSARSILITLVDTAGSFYFLTHKDNVENTQIEESNEMQLMVVNIESSSYLTLYGVAGIYDFRHQIKELYKPAHNAWFSGPDDPDIRIIRFQPFAGHAVSVIENKVWQLSKFTDLHFNRRKRDDDEIVVILN